MKLSAPPTRAPRGVTLTEVLMSLMIMGIGVSTVALLFPISVLRSANATKISNSVIHRYNAEAFTRIVPQAINLAYEWQPGKAYALNDVVIPTGPTRLQLPALVFICTTAGTSGSREPNWFTNHTAISPDGPLLRWTTFRLKNYIVDPIGYYDGNLTTMSGALPQQFGNTGTVRWLDTYPLAAASTFQLPIFRFSGGATSRDSGVALSMSPDTWQLVADSPTVTAASTVLPATTYETITLNDVLEDVDTATNGGNNGVLRRVVLFDNTGRRSVVRNFTVLAPLTIPQELTLTTSVDFLPTAARVEVLDQRYSWMLSVRRGVTSIAQIECVVSFRRKFGLEDERVLTAIFRQFDPGPDGEPGVAMVDDDGLNGVDDLGELGYGIDRGLSDDKRRDWIVVRIPTDLDQPNLRKGGYICDAKNLHWYRVADISDEFTTCAAATPRGFVSDDNALFWPTSGAPATLTAAGRFIRVTLDRPIVEDSSNLLGEIAVVTPAAPDEPVIGGVFLMSDVVDVFPLPQTLPSED